jgi:aspartyl-tRNA(Asn)/glutamyl-tRNA(Gln) amidotransferase subunit A
MDQTPTIAEAADLIAARKLSPVELTQYCLDRIALLDPLLHPFILLTEERALADAKASEARMMSGTSKGPLDGIPIAHKDIYNTAGIATTAHSKLLQDHVPEADATSVRSLAEAGTVLLGKLATHEFAMGGPSFDLPWPPPVNPWNTAHFTGGSSSGTGAAVAAGMILGGTGSDTGGSIRSPAAFCGIAGIKPTYGLIPRTGIQPLSYSLDHAGPMAWTVEDCAILLQAMAGHDPADPASATVPIPDYRAALTGDIKGLRIGVVRHFHETEMPVSPATQKGIDAALDAFRGLGAVLSDVTLPSLLDFQACGLLIMGPEAFAVHEPWLKTRFNDYGELLRNRLAISGLMSGADYVQALRRRRELCAETAAAMAEVDILITASQAAEAAVITEVPRWGLYKAPGFTFPFNVTGLPALSVCSGFGEHGLPVSIQLIGKPFQEATVLRAGHAFEIATPWRDRRPVLVAEPALG